MKKVRTILSNPNISITTACKIAVTNTSVNPKTVRRALYRSRAASQNGTRNNMLFTVDEEAQIAGFILGFDHACNPLATKKLLEWVRTSFMEERYGADKARSWNPYNWYKGFRERWQATLGTGTATGLDRGRLQSKIEQVEAFILEYRGLLDSKTSLTPAFIVNADESPATQAVVMEMFGLLNIVRTFFMSHSLRFVRRCSGCFLGRPRPRFALAKAARESSDKKFNAISENAGAVWLGRGDAIG
jgi:hypothetical protein